MPKLSETINALTADATPDGATDYVAIYDASGTTSKKVLLNNLPPVLITTSDADVTTPTDAELDSAFGTPVTVGDGFMAVLDDNGAGTNVWIVVAKNSKWWYAPLTEAT